MSEDVFKNSVLSCSRHTVTPTWASGHTVNLERECDTTHTVEMSVF